MPDKSVDEKPDVKNVRKTLVKFLIEKFENMNAGSSLNMNIVQSVQIKESEDGPGGVGLSGAKPDKLSDSQCAQNVNIQNGMKHKKKVWGVKSNGLYG